MVSLHTSWPGVLAFVIARLTSFRHDSCKAEFRKRSHCGSNPTQLVSFYFLLFVFRALKLFAQSSMHRNTSHVNNFRLRPVWYNMPVMKVHHFFKNAIYMNLEWQGLVYFSNPEPLKAIYSEALEPSSLSRLPLLFFLLLKSPASRWV